MEHEFEGWTPVRLDNVPVIDGNEAVLLCGTEGVTGDCYVAIHADGSPLSIVAFIDGKTANCHPIQTIPDDNTPDPRTIPPFVRISGDIAGKTGQVTILQESGYYRRYSRWDRLDGLPSNRPDAVVRTLPQCGCGGYLGAPMIFDSFAEMSAYFYIVFNDQSH